MMQQSLPTLRNHLDTLGDALPRVLVSAPCLASMKELGRRFPFDTTHDFGFESPLNGEAGGSDYIFLVRRGSIGASILAASQAALPLDPQAFGLQGHSELTNVFREWTQPGSITYSNLSGFLIEFPWEGTRHRTPPNIFTRFEVTSVDDRAQHDRILKVIEHVHNSFRGYSFPDAARKRLASVFAALPAGASIHDVRFSPEGISTSLRLSFTGFRTVTLTGFLAAIGWRGDSHMAGTYAADLSKYIDDWVIEIDVGTDIGSHIGVQAWYANDRQPVNEPRWSMLLERLVYRGLIDVPRRNALLAWPGVTTTEVFHKHYYHRQLMRLMFALRPDGEALAKGCFGVIVHH
jgi:hypothetical protein